MRSLGEAGVIEAETEALLIDNEIDFADFPEEVDDCLPQHFPWTIPKVCVCMCVCMCVCVRVLVCTCLHACMFDFRRRRTKGETLGKSVYLQ